MNDKDKLRLAMSQPHTVGGDDWQVWITRVVTVMNQDAAAYKTAEDARKYLLEENIKQNELICKLAASIEPKDEAIAVFQTIVANMEKEIAKLEAEIDSGDISGWVPGGIDK